MRYAFVSLVSKDASCAFCNTKVPPMLPLFDRILAGSCVHNVVFDKVKCFKQTFVHVLECMDRASKFYVSVPMPETQDVIVILHKEAVTGNITLP